MSSQNAADNDPVVRQLREQISDNDRAIVEGINKRLKLVERLWQYKAQRGYDIMAPEREGWMLSYLTRANHGPLSASGLREVYAALLDLTKREVGAETADEPAEAAGS